MTKAQAWKWCSKYIRLRDALNYCEHHNIDTRQFARVEDLPVKCCDCDYVASWVNMDAGHFVGRGIGGGSGAYFDERNIHAQSKTCNAGFRGDVHLGYKEFMLAQYSQDVIDQLHRIHRLGKLSKFDVEGLGQYYKAEYEALVRQVTSGTASPPQSTRANS